MPTEEPEDVKQVRNTLATKAVLTALDKAGVKVVRATQDMVDAVLEKNGVELNAKRKSAPETVSVTSEEAHQPTDISSADKIKGGKSHSSNTQLSARAGNTTLNNLEDKKPPKRCV